MPTKKKHATHNEEACYSLDQTKKFPDWVIICAFYSAIHFVDDKLFPNQYELPNGNVKNFSSFDDYFSKCKRGGSDKTKHDIRLHLVQEHLPEIAPMFNFLHDQSFTLRYSNYEVDQSEADLAIKHLKEIKVFCS
ncbi:MAG: hypothetical protein WDN75_10560 [Bacteroidota bacterium]